MTRSTFLQLAGSIVFTVGLSACIREDVGPYQPGKQTYALTAFDQLSMGSAFAIAVQAGPAFSITAEGDRRNLDDLLVYTRNGTLFAEYRNNRSRSHQTSFVITMPALRAVSFSGASQSTITGFTSTGDLGITLTGASKCQFTGEARQLVVDLSGASRLETGGRGAVLSARLTGSSTLQAFPYPVAEAIVNASGASNARVSVSTALTAEASGASTIRYRGEPPVRPLVSGASTVLRE